MKNITVLSFSFVFAFLLVIPKVARAGIDDFIINTLVQLLAKVPAILFKELARIFADIANTVFTFTIKELIIAMKIHSGRFSDIRDIVALYENTDHDIILKYVKRGDIKRVRDLLRKELVFMESSRFKDSFKGVFGFHVYKEEDLKNAIKGMQAVLKKL